MRRIGIGELEAKADEIDQLALTAPEIDQFCSSPDWILPAAAALMPPGQPWLFRGPAGLVATMLRLHGEVRVLEPLEAMWGLASPLVGRDAIPLALEAAALWRTHEAAWDALILTGVLVGSALQAALVDELGGRYRLALGPVTRRHVASLEGGVDGFLARRSRATRKSLRQAERRAAAAGIRFETGADGPDELFDRVLTVERRSWKGRDQVGLDTDGMREFYRLMTGRLAASGRLRCLFARQGEEDVAYVLGACFGDTYRGLQFAFDDRHRAVGLGNLIQLHQVHALAGEPAMRRYDLGTGGDYKVAWAEDEVTSIALVVVRR